VNRELILHLSLLDRIGPGIIQKIIQAQRSDVTASDLYAFSVVDWISYYGLTGRAAQVVCAGLANKELLEEELRLIEKHAIKWMTILDQEYPSLLREIYLPPVVLYWQGSGFNDVRKHVAVVGARKANAYGQKVVNSLVPELIGAGCTIVSGGALGIDAMAHDAALKSGGRTIVVLGSGLLNPYPASNKRLFSAVREHGGIVMSCFPLLMEPKQGNFPARNRVISGLSHGCLVVQAAQKSGSLITARYALEQGRDVFAVPGAIDDELSSGCNMLIQQGAKLVLSADDILQELGICTFVQDSKKMIAQVQQQLSVFDDNSYTPEQKHVLAACKQLVFLEEIVQVTGLDIFTLQAILFDLQLDGKIKQEMGMWIIQ